MLAPTAQAPRRLHTPNPLTPHDPLETTPNHALHCFSSPNHALQRQLLLLGECVPVSVAAGGPPPWRRAQGILASHHDPERGPNGAADLPGRAQPQKRRKPGSLQPVQKGRSRVQRKSSRVCAFLPRLAGGCQKEEELRDCFLPSASLHSLLLFPSYSLSFTSCLPYLCLPFKKKNIN
jgi:hypothetical protein